MLCGDVLGLMSCKRSENGQVLVGFQSTETFSCLHDADGGPAQRHRGVSPSLHVATDARNRAISGRDEPRVVLLLAATAAKLDREYVHDSHDVSRWTEACRGKTGRKQ